MFPTADFRKSATYIGKSCKSAEQEQEVVLGQPASNGHQAPFRSKKKKGSSNSVKSYSGAVSSPLARLDLKTPVDVQVDYELASILVVAIRPLRSHIWTGRP